MFEIGRYTQADIDSISWFYNINKRISDLKKLKETPSIIKQISSLQKRLETELSGEYHEVIEYSIEDGKPEVKKFNKKIRDGMLENLKQYLSEDTEKHAVNKYLKDKCRAKIKDDEIDNLDSIFRFVNFYEDEYHKINGRTI